MSKHRILLNTVVLVAMLLSFAPSVHSLAAPPPAPARQEPPWFDPAWSYRRPVTISSPCGEEVTDYQVLVTLDGSFGFSHAESDGSDLRVTDSDGQTEIPFWIEEWDSVGETANIWVKVPLIPVAGTTIYMYYGYPVASSTSNGDDTFVFFDDFSVGAEDWGNWQRVVVDDALDGSHNVVVEQVDDDGRPDLVVDAYRAEEVVWYRQPADPINDSWTKYTIDPDLPNAHDIKIGDIDEDGLRDVVGVSLSATYTNYGLAPGSLRWYKKPADPIAGTWISTTIASHAGLVGARSSGLGDIDSDTDLDIALAVDGGARLYWYQNPGGADALDPGLWDEYLIDSGAATGADAEVGDIDQDGNPDIVYAGSTGSLAGTLVYFAPDDPTDTGAWTRVPVAGDTYHVHIVDFDEDGDLDILRASAHSQLVSWLENPYPTDPRTPGNWNEYVIEQDPSIYVANRVSAADIDGDGDLDMGMDADPSGSTGVFKWYQRPDDPTDVDSYNIYTIDSNPTYTAYAHDSYLADVDLDSDIDMVGVGPNATGGTAGTGTVMWWVNNGPTISYIDPSKWNNGGGTVTDGVLTITGANVYIRSQATFQYKALRTKARYNVYANYGDIGFNSGKVTVGENDAAFVCFTGGTVDSITSDETGFAWGGTPTSEGADWKIWEILWNAGEAHFYVDSTLRATHTTHVPSIPLDVQFNTYSGSPTISVDWVLLREYCGSDPTVTVGSEEILSEAPIVSDPSPADGATDVPVTLPELSFLLSDAEGDLIDYTVTMTPDVIGGLQSGADVPSGTTIHIPTTGALAYNTLYTWEVQATDPAGSAVTTTETYTFTTELSGEEPLWFDPAWSYRRPVTVSNPCGEEVVDYQVLVTLDSSFDFGHAESDGSDLRVTDSDGQTEIPFWIEEWDSGGEVARIWVKVPSIPVDGTTIYLYYGNSGASPASDGEATFEFFDDDWSQFTDGAGNPVHTAGQSWWEATVSYPVVFEDTSFAGRPRFHMLYDGHAVIGHAKGYAWSSDLNTWTEYDAGEPHPPNPNPIMGVGYAGDAVFAWGDVMKVGDTYYMYVSRGPGTIYFTESTDLITWTNFQPITGGSFGTGAAILKEGDGITPIVVDGEYWMVYFTGGSPGSMYLASTDATGDLLSWTPWTGNPLLTPESTGWDQAGLWTPSFARLGDKYYIYYQGNGPAGWETGFASADAYDGGGTPIRPDNATWSKSDPDDDGNPDPVIRQGPAGSWDSGYVIDPMIREFDGTYYVFYTGNSANGYAYSASPEGPWTKFGEEGGPTVWQVIGTPTVTDGVLSLGPDAAVVSTSSYLYHAVGYRANFGGGGLSWGGFIDGSTFDRTMIGTDRPAENTDLYLKNYVSSVLNAVLPGSWQGSFHTYEVLWTAGASTGIVDHDASTATLTDQVPSTVLPVTFYNYEVSTPVLVDWVFVRQYCGVEPSVEVLPEEARPPMMGQLEVVKELWPDTDGGRFDLWIDGSAEATNVGHDGTTGPRAVISGTHTISETATADTGTDLNDYLTSIECRDSGGAGGVVASSSNAGPLDVPVADGDDILCTITNQDECLRTIWDDTATPEAPNAQAYGPLEVGVKFQAASDGYITGLRFYKGSSHTGTHTGHLWASDGTMLAEATYTGESPEGWQEVFLDTPVAIVANTTYVASVHSEWWYAVTDHYFDAAFDNPPLRALADGEDGPNGVYRYGPSAFPDQEHDGMAKNYWVDVIFNPCMTGLLEVVKDLLPEDDPGLFNLQIDGETAGTGADVGDGGTTGKVTHAGTHTVGEIAGTGTTLDDYITSTECRADGGLGSVVATSPDAGPLDVFVGFEDDIVCTITNQENIPSSIEVTKTANPTSLDEPGDDVEYTIVVTNTSSVDDVTINSIFDDQYTVTGCDATLPALLAPGGMITCVFTEYVAGQPGDTFINEASATGVDDDGYPVSDSDTADVTFNEVPSSIQVTKTANPTLVDEPGDDVEYTIVVTNTSSVDDVTINSIFDDQYVVTGCDATLPTLLAPGGMITCVFTEYVGGQPGDTFTNEATASGVDDDGYPVSDSDTADVSFKEVPSSIQVTKTANPTLVDEPGDDVEYTIVVENTSTADSVTISSISDDQYVVTGCDATLPALLAPGGMITCVFTEYVGGQPGDTFTDEASASGVDDDGYPVSDSDDAWVVVTDVASSIEVTKTASPTSVDEPGGDVEYTIVVENTSAVDDITINSISDDQYTVTGCDATVPALLVPGGMITCVFTEYVGGQPGDALTNMAWASGLNDDGLPVSDSDDALVVVTNVPSSIQVTKTASPTLVDEPGGDVEYTVVVENTSSVDNVTINSISDNKHTVTGCDATLPASLGPGGTVTCVFTAAVSGEPGDYEIDEVTAYGVDDDGYPESDSDDAIVFITNAPSSIEVTKTANPTSVMWPGGDVEYTIVVENTSSADSVTISSISDDLYTVTGCDATLPASLAPGALITCVLTEYVAGQPGDTFTNTASASGLDDDGLPVIDNDDATVDIGGMMIYLPLVMSGND